MTLQKRFLGRSEIQVAPWCLGGNVFGWTADEKTSFDLLDAFIDAGFDFIDTADVYSSWVPGHRGGESETVIGNWLAARKNRDRVVIATKLGMGQPGRNGRLDRAYIAESIEGSLKRLRTDFVDLYQSHRDDEATPQEETLEAYADLIKAGKVRIIGASNFSAARLGSALQVSDEPWPAPLRDPATAVQPRGPGGFRERIEAALSRRGRQRHPVLRAGRRLSHGEIPVRS